MLIAHTPSTVLQNKDKYIFVQARSSFHKSVCVPCLHSKGHAEGRSSQQQPPLQAAPALNLLPAATLGSNTGALPARLPALRPSNRSHSATAALNLLPLVRTASSDDSSTDTSLTGLDCCCMCDCENMTTSVRDEKIALVFETVFEEQASDEGEVAT